MEGMRADGISAGEGEEERGTPPPQKKKKSRFLIQSGIIVKKGQR